ncbi:glycosyltransferase family 4 protein [Aquibium microcysteis]|uniref:glycosyltransferase family 4 protein n=1 Tax=Aquibium microcysteis TaxID=675281 RepID=UPI00165CF856|nr:glycosyltransferase family 4 protein [Aquibium microcysteis]
MFIRDDLPGYRSGGPIRTIANLVEALGDAFDFRIVTSDRDATDERAYGGVDVDAWNRVGKASVWYASPAGRRLPALVRLVRDTPHDALYLNSFFDPEFTILPLLCRRLGLFPRRPCLLAPRGEFAPSALAIKPGKKKAYLAAAAALRLHGQVLFQASTPHERADVLRMFPASAPRIRVASDLPGPQAAVPATMAEERTGPIRICFLSRITPMKNLDYAIDVLSRLSTPASLDIYGPVRDDAYWDLCRRAIADLPPHVSAVHRGEVEHAAVPETLARYDLFFLPTRGENYGHVILEALAVGLPVLIADTTPWRGLASTGAGWDLPLADPDAFREKIEDVSRMDRGQRLQLRDSALALARRHLEDASTIEQNRQLLHDLTGRAA